MKKVFNFFIIVVSMFVLVGCKNSNKLDYTILYNQAGLFGYKEIDNMTHFYKNNIITSYQQLIDICNRWNNNSFKEDDKYYNSERAKLIRSFDEKYFITNNLILINFVTANYLKTKIKKVEYNDSQIKVELKQTNKYGIYTTEAYSWLMIIKIDKLNDDNLELIVNIR